MHLPLLDFGKLPLIFSVLFQLVYKQSYININNEDECDNIATK